MRIIATSFWWWILIALWYSITKRGSTYLSNCRVFVFRGRAFFLLELVEIRLYLGASLCIYLFWLLMYSCWAIHFWGRYIYCFICFLFHCLLTYILDVIHWYLSLFCVLRNQEFILSTCIFHTCIYASCLVFQEKYRLIQLSCCLHLQLMYSS